MDMVKTTNIGPWAFVKDVQWNGEVKIYKNVDTDAYIAVSRAYTFDRGDETMIFAYDIATDYVSSWVDLYAGYGETHEEALQNYVDES